MSNHVNTIVAESLSDVAGSERPITEIAMCDMYQATEVRKRFASRSRSLNRSGGHIRRPICKMYDTCESTAMSRMLAE